MFKKKKKGQLGFEGIANSAFKTKGPSMIYLGWIVKPLSIDKELVLMLPFRQVQDRHKVIMAFGWRKTNRLLCNKQ